MFYLRAKNLSVKSQLFLLQDYSCLHQKADMFIKITTNFKLDGSFTFRTLGAWRFLFLGLNQFVGGTPLNQTYISVTDFTS